HLLHHQRSLSQAVEALNPQGALPASKRVLAFAPHFDDESLLFGSALASAVEGGADVRLVWLTNGGAHARIRREEAEQAAKTLGVSDHHLLGAPETRLHAGGAWVQKLRRLMVDFHPTRVLLPWWLDNHIDHFETTRVLAAAAQGQALDFEIAATGFWTPLPGGHAVAHHPLKEQALACHSSQLDEVDYLACAKGLSRWGGGDPNERYWCLPAREYLRRFAASGAARRRYRN
ncbi:MAG: PIG-L family deacetylase, partial [Planctomycetes bacterium]|nr:PIG-L family deacetylase [Planctomycetota bacterium]